MTYRAYLLVLVAVVAVAQATAGVLTVAHTRDQIAAASAPAPPPTAPVVAPTAALAGGVAREAPPAPSLPADSSLHSLNAPGAAPVETMPAETMPAETAPVSAWTSGPPCDPATTVTCVAPEPAWEVPLAP